MYDYSAPLDKSSAIVNLYDYDGFKNVDAVREGIDQASRNYNFSFRSVQGAEVSSPDLQSFKHSLLIILCDSPFSKSVVNKALEQSNNYSVISIAFTYGDEKEMLSYVDEIDKVKRDSNDQINFLRPLLESDSACRVPIDKLVDNSICDSVRIKYRPIVHSSDRLELDDEVLKFFQKASELYSSHRLYHRSKSDGYFACKKPGTEGFYITATKTYKEKMDMTRVSRVISYDEETNTLTYEGAHLPSSDAVEAAILFEKHNDIHSIVHSHASERFTRNPEYRDRMLIPRASYGEPQLGHLLAEKMNEVDDGFLIMEDHGEVFAGKTLDISASLLKELKLI